MNMKLLAGACAAAVCSLWVGQAMADPSAVVGGSYNYSEIPGSSGHLDNWNVNGAVMAPITANIDVQGDASYDSFSANGGGSFHTTQASGSAFWQGAKGRIGLTAGYNEFGAGGFSAHFENYGAFGVFEASDKFTFGAKGGALTGSGLSATYLGAEVIGYVNPNLAVSGTVDVLNNLPGLKLRTYGAKVEYLVSETMPISVTGGYTYTDLGGPHLNTYMVGMKFYFGKGSTLADHQRSGAETWGTKQSALTFLF